MNEEINYKKPDSVYELLFTRLNSIKNNKTGFIKRMSNFNYEKFENENDFKRKNLNSDKKNKISILEIRKKSTIKKLKIVNFKNYLENIKLIKNLNKKWFIINPDIMIIKLFEIIINILIIYSITFTPYYIAFYSKIDSGFLYKIDISLDIIFIIEIFKNFFTGYYDKQQNLILNFNEIFINYFFGWFWIDLISSIPFNIILGNSYFNFTKLIRIPKVTRIMKIMKIAKIIKILKILKDKNKILKPLSNIKPGIERLFILIFISFLIFHIIGCFWFIIGDLEDSELNWVNNSNINNESILKKYLTSVYWTVQTIFTVGYGDFEASNNIERSISIFIMFIGVFLYSFIIGSITNILNLLNKNDKEIENKLNLFNNLSKQ